MMGTPPLTTIGFDADDTLWHNETLFAHSHREFVRLLSDYHDARTVEDTLFKTEMRNLPLYGYGIKSFALSSIETAIELTRGEIAATEIRQIIELAHEMLRHPVELLPGVVEAIKTLREDHRLILITKGDLHDQQRKVEQSGLGALFSEVVVVAEKKVADYERTLGRIKVDPGEFVMVGNSLKSDILPILELGGYAIHVPYEITWAHEEGEPPSADHPRFARIDSIIELPAALRRF